jgi:hypothetical protein
MAIGAPIGEVLGEILARETYTADLTHYFCDSSDITADRTIF